MYNKYKKNENAWIVSTIRNVLFHTKNKYNIRQLVFVQELKYSSEGFHGSHRMYVYINTYII